MNYIEKFDNFFTYKNLFIFEQPIHTGLTGLFEDIVVVPMVIEDKELGTTHSTVHILRDGDLKTFRTFDKYECDIPRTFKVIKVFNREHLLDLLDFI